MSRIGIYPHGGVFWHDNKGAGSFRVVYQLTPQLTDQSAEYAYMSMALAHFAPCGRGTFAGAAPNPLQPSPLVAMQRPNVAGIPTTAGVFTRNPLSK